MKPKEVAVRFYLYAPRGLQGQRDYTFEDKLALLEELFAPPCWNGIRHPPQQLALARLERAYVLAAAPQ